MYKFLLTGLLVLCFSGCGSDPVASEEETATVATSSGSSSTPSELQKKEDEQLFEDSGSGAASGSGATGQDTTNQMEKQVFGEAILE